MRSYSIIERHLGGPGQGWHATVEVHEPGVPAWRLRVGLLRGSPARGMYGVKGFRWIGYVNSERGTTLWREREPKSIGVRGILEDARIIPSERMKRRLKEQIRLVREALAYAREHAPASVGREERELARLEAQLTEGST